DHDHRSPVRDAPGVPPRQPRLRLHGVQALHPDAPRGKAHGRGGGGGLRRVPDLPGSASRRVHGALQHHPHQRHRLLARPGRLVRARARPRPRPGRGGRGGLADPRVERRVRLGRGDVHAGDGVRRGAGPGAVQGAGEDLRHRRGRGGAGAGPGGHLRRAGDGGDAPGAARPLLRAVAGRVLLPPRPAPPGDLWPARPGARRPHQPPGPAGVAQRADVLQRGNAGPHPHPLPLRPQGRRRPLLGEGGDDEVARRPVHPGGPQGAHLQQGVALHPPRPAARHGAARPRGGERAGDAAAPHPRRRAGRAAQRPAGGGRQRCAGDGQRASPRPLRPGPGGRGARPAGPHPVVPPAGAALAHRAGVRRAPAPSPHQRGLPGARRGHAHLRRVPGAADGPRRHAPGGERVVRGRVYRAAGAGAAPGNQPGAGDGLRGAAEHQRGAGDHQRRAAEHHRGAGDDQRGAAEQQRRAGDDERGAPVHQRGAGDDQRRDPAADGRAQRDQRLHDGDPHLAEVRRGGAGPRLGHPRLEPQGRGAVGAARGRGGGRGLPEPGHRPAGGAAQGADQGVRGGALGLRGDGDFRRQPARARHPVPGVVHPVRRRGPGDPRGRAGDARARRGRGRGGGLL
ncbi:MAG: Multidomain signal transduction protein including CheB-like methylesterase, CheR-like methyltransferase and BaeS-like histidine kinase, partial [uncultured Gemmatimonadetes bacterium]